MAAAGVVVIPAAGMEGVAPKIFHARYTGKPWPVSGACAEANMASPHFITMVGLNQPSFFVLEPAELCHPSLKNRVFVKPKVLPNALRVFIDFWCKGIAKFGHVARLLEEREVAVGLNVTLCPRVTIPVPGSAEVAPAFNNSDSFDACLDQACSCEHAYPATADDYDFSLVFDGISLNRLAVRVFFEVFIGKRRIVRELNKLRLSVFSDTFFTFFGIAFRQGVRIKPK